MTDSKMTCPARLARIITVLALTVAGAGAQAAELTPAELDHLTNPAGWERTTAIGRETLFFQTHQNRYVHTISRVRNGREEHQATLGNFSFTAGKLVLRSYVRNCPTHFEGMFVLDLQAHRLDLGGGRSFALATEHRMGPSDNVPGCFVGGTFRARDEFAPNAPAAPPGTAPLTNAKERSRWHWTAGDLHGYYDDIENGPLFLWPDGRYALVVPVVASDMTPDFDATVRNLDKGLYGKYRVLSLGDPRRVGIVFHSAEGGTSEANFVRGTLWWRMRGRRERFQVHPAPFRELFGTYTRSVSMSTDRGYLPPGTLRVDVDISNSTKVTFGEGRRFRWNSNTVVMTPTSAGDATGSPQQAAFDGTTGTNSSGGSYEIVGTFIVLRFDDGRVERHVFGTSGPRAEYIRIGGRQFSSSQWRVVR